jgi:membrane-bound lytic murein transglycosylase A
LVFYFFPRIVHHMMNASSPPAMPASSSNQVMIILPAPLPPGGRGWGRGREFSARALLLALAVLAGCATPPEPPPACPACACPPVEVKPCPPTTPTIEAKPELPGVPPLAAASWDDLPGWREDDPGEAWDAFLKSCAALRAKPAWREACDAARGAAPGQAHSFFETHFQPWRVVNADGSDSGLITGYYEPLLMGGKRPTARARYPVYGVPDDLLVVDLAGLYPELKSMRLRGRVEGNRVVPYYTRADIETGAARVQGRELAWVEDAVELFFLQIQGSGRIQMDTGEVLRVGYADQNGHPYRSIGKILVQRGELTLDQASMQGIQDWARRHPDKLPDLLNANPSFVFFKPLPSAPGGPPGALGVPLTPERSIAIDPRSVPLGAPVFLATTRPLSDEPMQRLMLAQDTGGAIRGRVRADFFWGFGPDAGAQAGRMKQPGRMWVLLPQGYPVDAPANGNAAP